MDILTELQNILKRWRSGVKTLNQNIEEAQSKNLSNDQLKGYRDGLNENVHDLVQLVKRYEQETKKSSNE